MRDLDLRNLFENLAEKEKIKGHHSAEGRAIRTLSRALSGWLAGNLDPIDVLVLCDQAIEDWLKAKLKLSNWSTLPLAEIMPKAIQKDWLTRGEAVRLQRIRNLRRAASEKGAIPADRVADALQFCIRLVEKHW
jgi:hypothetical protein